MILFSSHESVAKRCGTRHQKASLNHAAKIRRETLCPLLKSKSAHAGEKVLQSHVDMLSGQKRLALLGKLDPNSNKNQNK